ncbi:unnamed protein product [Dimorphilus gyrociliatus]|uniref:Uncharacterized protein n=1 Tax=Dimorphilus gyrociliatus TaxID=2664684 RepID=A0A7I8VKU4_9ANNE|nr:unnamed protein product [Dimorphilus gyrociliatus]
MFFYGFLFGGGCGLQFTSSLAAATFYFKRYATLAFCLQSVSFGFGCIVLPLPVTFLIQAYGWQGSMILLAGLPMQQIWLALLLKPATSGQVEDIRKLNKEDKENRELEREWLEPLKRRLLRKKMSAADVLNQEEEDRENIIVIQAVSRRELEVVSSGIMMDENDEVMPVNTEERGENEDVEEEEDDEEAIWKRMTYMTCNHYNEEQLCRSRSASCNTTAENYVRIVHLAPYAIGILLSNSIWAFITIWLSEIAIVHTKLDGLMTYKFVSLFGFSCLISRGVMSRFKSVKPFIGHFIISIITSATLFLAPSLIDTYNGLSISIMLIGCSTNASFCLITPSIIRLMNKSGLLKPAFNICLLCCGVGSLIGPLLGAVLTDYTGDFTVSFYVAGITSLLSAMFVAFYHFIFK